MKLKTTRNLRKETMSLALDGTTFGSYNPNDVTWLIKDLSNVELEAPREEREEAVQKGKAHYAESLPIEYQPDEDYRKLFLNAVEADGHATAKAVATVTEMVMEHKVGAGENTVLVSLARAGTPVGILMRKYATERWGYNLPHYAISIVRGRGIDENALNYIAERHDSKNVIFVDGWTGKGAITGELQEAMTQYNDKTGHEFSSQLAVLADPADTATYYGTTDDFLIPSACLNSTVSGLISRTVLNDNFIGEHDFHGAKFYRELADDDYSQFLIDSISEHFNSIIKSEELIVPEPNYAPQWVGMRVVKELSEEFGVDNMHLIKPSVGETTRVLLRRVPWKIVYNPERKDFLGHVFKLAEDRGVELVPRDGLPYSCVGIIKPEGK